MGWSEVKEEKAAVQAGFGGHERNPIPNALVSAHATDPGSSPGHSANALDSSAQTVID